MYSVYILRSLHADKLYIGFTSILENRLTYHNSNYSRSTKYGRPWKIVYTESFKTKQEAINREKFLKKQKNRDFYNRLINGA